MDCCALLLLDVFLALIFIYHGFLKKYLYRYCVLFFKLLNIVFLITEATLGCFMRRKWGLGVVKMFEINKYNQHSCGVEVSHFTPCIPTHPPTPVAELPRLPRLSLASLFRLETGVWLKGGL